VCACKRECALRVVDVGPGASMAVRMLLDSVSVVISGSWVRWLVRESARSSGEHVKSKARDTLAEIERCDEKHKRRKEKVKENVNDEGGTGAKEPLMRMHAYMHTYIRRSKWRISARQFTAQRGILLS